MEAHTRLTENCGWRENRRLEKEQRETGGGSNSGDREIVAQRREAEPPGFRVYV